MYKSQYYPSDWIPRPLGEVCAINIGGTPSRDQDRFWAQGEDGYPWVAISDMGPKLIIKTNERITKKGVISSNAKFVRAGTTLMSFKLTLGRMGIAGIDLYTNEAIAAFVPKSKGVDSKWLYHFLPEIVMSATAEQAIKGQTLNKKKLNSLTAYLPSDYEQCHIAEILDTIDEAIQKTGALISKLKAMKQGLLHDLLTRGLDKNGKLRDPKTHLEQFKDSPLGRIPVKWEVEPLSRLVFSHKAGIYKHMSEYGEGSRIVGVSDLFQHEYISNQSFRLVRLSKTEKEEYCLNEGDLLYAESSLVFGGIAKTLAVTEEGAGTAFAWHTRKLSVNKSRINYKFLSFALNSPPVRSFVRTRATQTALTGIPVDGYFETLVPIPDIDEQHRIVTILDIQSSRIHTEEQYRDKLKLQKKGLMHDLLTGKVRVKV